MNIGQAVKDLRRSKKIKAKYLAERCGISKTALSNIESNRSFPTMPTILGLCDALGVSVAALMVHSLTEEDVPVEKREAFRVLIVPVKEFLNG